MNLCSHILKMNIRKRSHENDLKVTKRFLTSVHLLFALLMHSDVFEHNVRICMCICPGYKTGYFGFHWFIRRKPTRGFLDESSSPVLPLCKMEV
jgi:hypothetical protein